MLENKINHQNLHTESRNIFKSVPDRTRLRKGTNKSSIGQNSDSLAVLKGKFLTRNQISASERFKNT